METIDLSIIIVSWNACELLRQALTCVYQTVQRSSYEVIVVDNNSAEPNVAMVRAEFPQATLIANGENIGFGRANNQAAALARGRYLLLLNPDAFVHDGTIDRLVAFMDQHPDAGSAGPRLRYPDGRLQRSTTAFPTVLTELWMATGLDRAFPRSPVFGRFQMTYWELDDLRSVDALMGACLIICRGLVERIGLFDEQFFMYAEEVDLCYRIRQAGLKNYFLPDVEATHVWGGSSRLVPSATFMRHFRSRVQFFRKHYGEGATAIYKTLLLLSGAARFLGGPLVFALRRESDLARAYLNYLTLVRSVRSL
jgi:GT2 family glycosyltransferase